MNNVKSLIAITMLGTYSGFGFSPFGIEKFWNSNRTRSKFCESCIPYIKYLKNNKQRMLKLLSDMDKNKMIESDFDLTYKQLFVNRGMDNLDGTRIPWTPFC